MPADISFFFREMDHALPHKQNPSQNKEQSNRAFISKSQRFQENLFPDVPGPGSYESGLKEQRTSNFRVDHSRRNQEFIRLQHQWIVSEGRFNQSPIGQKVPTLGPGSYQMPNQLKSSYHSGWNKTQRFVQQQKYDIVGPGSYNCSDAHRSMTKIGSQKGLSMFKSRSPRSYLDEIKKEPVILEQEVMDPEMTELQSKRKVRSHLKIEERPQSIFVSKSERGTLVNQTSTATLGPGSYQVEELSSKTLNLVKLKPIKRSNFSHSKPEPTPVLLPGPGHYNIKLDLLEKQIAKRAVPFGSLAKQDRFQYPNDLIPGPGQYMQNKFQYIDEKQFNGKAKPVKEQFALSKDERNKAMGGMETPFGKYNANILDIEYRMQKQKKHLNRLKMLEVQLPAFSSKLDRLT